MNTKEKKMKLLEVIGGIIKSDSSFITLSIDLPVEANRDAFNDVLKDDGWKKIPGISTLWQKSASFHENENKESLYKLIEKARKKPNAEKIRAVYIVGTKASKL